jgi:colanic acid/amylovoran biosynthesis glycosyltransferase
VYFCLFARKNIMKKTFDLIIFTDHFPYGNSESFLSDELSFLSKAFKNILIVPLNSAHDSPKRDVPGNVTVYPPPFWDFKSKISMVCKGLFNLTPVIPFISEGISHKIWRSSAMFRNWTTSFFLIRALTTHLKKLLKKDQVGKETLFYFYWGLRWSQVIPFLPGRFDRLFIRMHGSDLYEEMNHNYIPFRHEQIKRAKGVFLISGMAQKYFLGQYPFMENKTFCSRLGSRDRGINPPRADVPWFHVVSCSNLVPVKRIQILAESLKYIKKNIRWTHFGTGPDTALILEIIKDGGDSFQAELKGWVSHDELMHYYASCHIDLFVNTSSSEGIPVSVMEALSFGIPVIATDVGGTSEIVDESCGKIIPAEITPGLLANEIETFLSIPGMDNYRTNARKSWENTSDCSKLYPDFVELLKNLV